MSIYSLTPNLLDQPNFSNSFLNSSPETHPTQYFTISPEDFSKITKIQDFHTPIQNSKNLNKSTFLIQNALPDDSYRYVPKTRSSSGKAKIKLYPSFYNEPEINLQNFNKKDRIMVQKIDEILTTQKKNFDKPFANQYFTEQKFNKPKDVEKIEPKKLIVKMQNEAANLIKEHKFRQSMSKLYDCERFIFTHKIKDLSIKTYTNYLVILTYYKSKKYEKTIECIKKTLENYEEFDFIGEQYILLIKQIWAKCLIEKNEILSGIKILHEICEQFENSFKSDQKLDIFGREQLLKIKSEIAENYMVFLLIFY